ncbi:MAG: hypothetical protein ACI31R_00085 [Bacilli bacterium]
MKNIKKITGLALTLSLVLSPVSVFASQKTESVYTKLDSNGQKQEITVTNHLYYNGEKTLKDNTELKEILNINGEETYKQDKNTLYWNTKGEDIFYQGKTDKQLPIEVNIKYYLNNKEVKPEDIKGKKGNIKIEFNYKNNQKNNVNVNGVNQTLYTPFVVSLGTTLDSKQNKNITVTNGKITQTGTRSMLIALASPGLYDSINYDSFKTLDNITIKYKTENFSLNDIYMVITPKLIDKEDFKVFDKMDTLYTNTQKLQESMNELQSGANKLSEGAKNLSTGTKEISNNIKNVASAIEKLNNGSITINNGLEQVITALNKAKNSLNDNNSSENITSLKYLKSQNTNAINSLISKTGLTYEELENYYTSNNLTNYTGEDETLNKIKSSYELITLLSSNNLAIDNTITSLEDITTQINSMLTELNKNLTKIKNGSASLNTGLTDLKNGVNKLYSGSIILTNGAKSLSSGTTDLNQGIQKFNSEGITKLTNYSKKLKTKKDQTQKLIELANNYKGYASKNGQESTFIYKVDAIK